MKRVEQKRISRFILDFTFSSTKRYCLAEFVYFNRIDFHVGDHVPAGSKITNSKSANMRQMAYSVGTHDICHYITMTAVTFVWTNDPVLESAERLKRRVSWYG